MHVQHTAKMTDHLSSCCTSLIVVCCENVINQPEEVIMNTLFTGVMRLDSTGIINQTGMNQQTLLTFLNRR